MEPASDIAAAIAPLVEEVQALRAEVRTLRNQRDADRLLDLDEAADLLAISRRTVDTLVADGELPSVKVRRCRRIPARALRAYVRALY